MEYISREKIEKVLQQLNDSNKHKEHIYYVEDDSIVCEGLDTGLKHNFTPADLIIDIDIIPANEKYPTRAYIKFDSSSQGEDGDTFTWICCNYEQFYV